MLCLLGMLLLQLLRLLRMPLLLLLLLRIGCLLIRQPLILFLLLLCYFLPLLLLLVVEFLLLLLILLVLLRIPRIRSSRPFRWRKLTYMGVALRLRCIILRTRSPCLRTSIVLRPRRVVFRPGLIPSRLISAIRRRRVPSSRLFRLYDSGAFEFAGAGRRRDRRPPHVRRCALLRI